MRCKAAVDGVWVDMFQKCRVMVWGEIKKLFAEENLRRIKYTIINVYYFANLALIAFEASS